MFGTYLIIISIIHIILFNLIFDWQRQPRDLVITHKRKIKNTKIKWEKKGHNSSNQIKLSLFLNGLEKCPMWERKQNHIQRQVISLSTFQWRKAYRVTKLQQLFLSICLEWLLSYVGPHLYWGTSGKVCSFWIYQIYHVAPTPRKSINGGGAASGGSPIRTLFLSSAKDVDDDDGSLAKETWAVVDAEEFEKLQKLRLFGICIAIRNCWG